MDPNVTDVDAQIIAEMVSADSPTDTASSRDLSNLKFSAKQQFEVARLLDKNNAGTISAAEHRRLDSYVRIGNQLNIFRLLTPDS